MTWAFDSGHPAAEAFTRRYRTPPEDGEDPSELATLLEQAGARDWATRRASEHTHDAIRALPPCLTAPTRAELEALPSQLDNRTF
ncbi:hypothetical protein [Amycolatopsis sp. NPDC001319]|uniref:hypothetical protein n=1 Tax=unclassified Amycolatopsis TaxID=2618356 RepID=UPI0036739F31